MTHTIPPKQTPATRRLVATLAAGMLAGACAQAPTGTVPSDTDLLHAAVQHLSDVMVYDIFSPPHAARTFAYSAVAAYETVRHGDDSYVTLAGQLNELPPAPAPPEDEEVDLALAGVHAFMTVGTQMVYSRERLDSLHGELHEAFRSRRLPRRIFEASLAYGDAVASHVLAWAATDGYAESRGYPKYTVTTEPGRWVPTPPGYMEAVEPNWPMLRPLVLDSASQFRTEVAVPFDMSEGSPFYDQVLEVYEIGRTLDAERREIAAFWDCNPYVLNVQGHAMFATKQMSPGAHWMGIAGIASRKAGADLAGTAETYARMVVAVSDGFLSAWDEKYYTNLIRPETVINAYIDEDWMPLLQTPPFPEYTSAHSVISAAAAQVLTDQFGPEFAFADSTELAWGLPVRSFPSFRAAAEEAAVSRLYGGIHYRMAADVGTAQGTRVGELVVDRIRTRPQRAADAGGGS